jgi:hypothetical protein
MLTNMFWLSVVKVRAVAGQLVPVGQTLALQLYACQHPHSNSMHSCLLCIFCAVCCRSSSRSMMPSRLAPACLLLLVCLYQAEGKWSTEAVTPHPAVVDKPHGRQLKTHGTMPVVFVHMGWLTPHSSLIQPLVSCVTSLCNFAVPGVQH